MQCIYLPPGERNPFLLAFLLHLFLHLARRIDPRHRGGGLTPTHPLQQHIHPVPVLIDRIQKEIRLEYHEPMPYTLRLIDDFVLILHLAREGGARE